MESQKANQSDKKQKQVKPEQNKEEKPKKKLLHLHLQQLIKKVFNRQIIKKQK
jgi:hypothetical protein